MRVTPTLVGAAAITITAGLAAPVGAAATPPAQDVTVTAARVARLGVQIPLAADGGRSYVRLHWAPIRGVKNYKWRSLSSNLTANWSVSNQRAWTPPAAITAVHLCTAAERSGADTVGDETTLTRAGGSTSFVFPQLSGKIPDGDLCGLAYQAPHTMDTPRVAFQVFPAGTAPTATTSTAWTPCPVSAFVAARGSGEVWQEPLPATYNTMRAQVTQFSAYAAQYGAVTGGNMTSSRTLTADSALLAGLGKRGVRTYLMATQPGITNYSSASKSAFNRWAVRPVAVDYPAVTAGPVPPEGVPLWQLPTQFDEYVLSMGQKWTTMKPSVDHGVTRTQQIVWAWNTQCSSPLTLFGYSQGAQVIGDTANLSMTWKFGTPIPEHAKNVRQMLLLSDPEADPSTMPANDADPLLASPATCRSRRSVITVGNVMWGASCADGQNPDTPKGAPAQGVGVWRYLGKNTASRANLASRYHPPLFHWCAKKDVICSAALVNVPITQVHGDIYEHYEPVAAGRFLYSITGNMFPAVSPTGAPKSLAATYAERSHRGLWSWRDGWYGKTPDFQTFAPNNPYSVPPNDPYTNG